jgi:hypothetical protein
MGVRVQISKPEMFMPQFVKVGIAANVAFVSLPNLG